MLEVRRVDPIDVWPQLAELLAASEAEIRATVPDYRGPSESELLYEAAQRRLVVFTARVAGVVVGYVHFSLRRSHDELVADDVDVYVRPDHRRTRAAHSMLAAAKRWCRGRGVARVFTSIETGRPHPLAEHYGFRPVQVLYQLDLA